MTVKRLARSGQSRYASAYGLDYGLKHRSLTFEFKMEHSQLLDARDPQLRLKNARAITVEGNNCNPYDPEPDFARERKHWGKNQRRNQAGVYVLAANKKNWDELKNYLADRDHDGDRSKVKSIDQYREWGKMSLELGEAIAGNGKDFQSRLADGKKYGQVAVQTHADEHGMHAHIEVNAIHMGTGLKMNYKHDELMTIYNFADDIYRSRGLTITQPGLERVLNPDTGKYVTRRRGGYSVQHQGKQISSMVKQGKYSYVDDLNCQFELVLADPEVDSKEKAEKKLRERNIAIDQWDTRHKYIKAHIIKLPINIKTHGKLTRKKGKTSRSMRVRTFTRKEADHELSLPVKERELTRERLSARLDNYQTANNVEPEKYTLRPNQEIIKQATARITPQVPVQTATQTEPPVEVKPQRQKYSYVDDLNLQFELVLADPKINSKEQASEELKQHNVAVDQWDDDHKFIKAHIIKLPVDIKSHGRLSRIKGQPSRSMRIKSFTRAEANQELSLPVSERELTRERLMARLDNSSSANAASPEEQPMQPQQEVVQQAVARVTPTVVSHSPAVNIDQQQEVLEQEEARIDRQKAAQEMASLAQEEKSNAKPNGEDELYFELKKLNRRQKQKEKIKKKKAELQKQAEQYEQYQHYLGQDLDR